MQYMQREEGASTSFAIFIISGDIVSGVFFFFAISIPRPTRRELSCHCLELESLFKSYSRTRLDYLPVPACSVKTNNSIQCNELHAPFSMLHASALVHKQVNAHFRAKSSQERRRKTTRSPAL